MYSLADLILSALAGSAVGVLIGWLIAARRGAARPDERLEKELRQQLAQREAELARSREDCVQSSVGRAAAEASRAAAEKLLADQQTFHEQNLQSLRAAQEKAVVDLREAFKALSAEALKQTQPDFLRLANETLAKFHETARGDLARRQEAIATLVKPLEEQLKIYQERLAQSENLHSSALGEVKKHLETLTFSSQSLSQETLQLRRVLSSNQARGRWGEETLRRVIEASGMSAHCDFEEQTQAGDSKPDLLIHLPGDRLIIVDAKVPDLEFLTSLEGADNAKRAEILADHAAKLRSTVKALSDRNYPGQFSRALDYVILFLPAESLFSAALEGDENLIIWAASRKIMLATPASLIGLLRAVSLSWQQQAQTDNARAIAVSAEELFNRVTTFFEHLERMRAGLEKAQLAFNDAVGSYERSVRPSAERLKRLGGCMPGKELPDIKTLETTLRLPLG